MVDKCRFCGRVLGSGHTRGCKFWRHPRPWKPILAALLFVPLLSLLGALPSGAADPLQWWEAEANRGLPAPPGYPRLIPIALDDDKPPARVYEKGYKPLTPERRAELQAVSRAQHGGRIAMLAKNLALPPSSDARARFPLPMWDQGPCGSCFEVSTVRTLNCALGVAGYGKPDGSFIMSAQYGMDRPRNFGGCGGGNGTEVIDWACRNGWVAEKYVDASGVAHNDYPPYEARSGNDRTKPGAKVWKGFEWGFVNDNGKPTLTEIKAALVTYGRLNIALDAGGQFGNGTGTITAMGNSIDHEINTAGYDDEHDNGDGTKGAFLLENQWGKGWGDGGYRWCTYKASTHIVDWFFVSAGPLPPPDPVPPPPPPPPPGSKVASHVTITYTDGSTQVLPAPNSITVTKDTTIAEILNKLKEVKEGAEPPLAQPTDKSNEDRWRDNDRALKAILDKLDLIDKQLGIKKP